jgi:benzil reductase ((S)-benzoin forming)
MILITGTSSGIGNGLAHHYLSLGKKVIGISRRQASDLQQNPLYRHLQFDLRNIESNSKPLESFLSELNSLELVVLNAGILGKVSDMKDTDVNEIKQTMNVNVWANKYLIDLILANVPQVEMIVGMSSGASISGSRGWNGYSISKASLNMMMKLYANENEQTKFYAFAPGLVDTVMQDYICEEVDDLKFPTAARIKGTRNTPSMPKPNEAAHSIAKAFQKLSEYQSGEFVDIRKM